MTRKTNSQRGQAVVELAFQIPLMLLLLFGGFQIARIFYTYHTLQKALRGGAGFVARSTNVNYCAIEDATLAAARNFVVFGNLPPGTTPTPVVPGLTTDMIQILPERGVAESTAVTPCTCGNARDDPESCDVLSGGRAPDFVVVNLGSGFPLTVPFPFVNLGTINLNVSVRMPVTGG